MEPEDDPRHFDPDAQMNFNQWRHELEDMVRSGEHHSAYEAHISKYRSLMPSLALLLYLADSGRGDVPAKYAELSSAWCEYLESHANRVYSVVTNGPNTAARLIAEKITKGNLTNPFTARNVLRPQWAGLTDRNNIRDGLMLLVDDDWLRPDTIEIDVRPM